MAALSINGWPANNRALVASQLIPGSQVKVTVRKDAPGLLLLEVASAFDRLVEDIDNARGALDDWGYAERPIRGGSATSNHASGTAIDLNAVKHPFRKRGTFTAAQFATIRRIRDACGGVVVFGGDWTDPVDEMHFEIAPRKTLADCERALAAMRKFNGTAPTPEVDELSATYEKDDRARWAKQDALEKDLRGDLHLKQLQMDRIEAAVKALTEKVDALAPKPDTV